MRIGIDARLWYETGVGRYIRALVNNLASIDKKNQYILFLKKNAFEKINLINNNWQKIPADVAWHSVNEQLVMPKIFRQANLDLLHIPYFSVPFFTSVPFVVTIHDLTISYFETGRATTKPKPVYWLKRWGYNQVINKAVHKAKTIITVSESVKEQIIKEFGLSPDKIQVTYESGEFDNNDMQPDNSMISQPKEYILFVGNAYPHKNLLKLINAFEIIKPDFPALKLVLAGKSDYFYNRLKYEIQNYTYYHDIIFTGNINNASLYKFYKKAAVFVFPSLSEGFGIPGLEAMLANCPVIASDIKVFHEIYRDAAYYFNPDSERDLAQKLTFLLKNQDLRKKLVTHGNKQAKKYSWQEMARKTLKIYESCFSL